MSVGLERLWCTCEAIWGGAGSTVSPAWGHLRHEGRGLQSGRGGRGRGLRSGRGGCRRGLVRSGLPGGTFPRLKGSRFGNRRDCR